jgi:hypothetical protein
MLSSFRKQKIINLVLVHLVNMVLVPRQEGETSIVYMSSTGTIHEYSAYYYESAVSANSIICIAWEPETINTNLLGPSLFPPFPSSSPPFPTTSPSSSPFPLPSSSPLSSFSPLLKTWP